MNGYRHAHHNTLTKKSIRSVNREKRASCLFYTPYSAPTHSRSTQNPAAPRPLCKYSPSKIKPFSSRLQIQQCLGKKTNQQNQCCPSTASQLFITCTCWIEYSTQVPASPLHVAQAYGSLILKIILLPIPASPLQ